MIVHQHVLKTLCYQSASRLILEVNVLDESSHFNFSTLHFTLNGITRVDIATVHINWSFGRFVHRDGLDLSCLFFGSFTKHHVQIIRQKNLSVVQIAKLVDSCSDLDLLRNVDSVNFEFTANWSLTSLARVQGEGHFNAVLFAEFV